MDTGQSDEILRDTRLRDSVLQTFERKCGNNAPVNFSFSVPHTYNAYELLSNLPLPSPLLTLIAWNWKDVFLQANNRYLEDKLLNFLILDLYGVTSLERKIIFFYCTYLVEKYQEKVPVWQSE